MAGPWEDYQKKDTVQHGPWEEYGVTPGALAGETAPPPSMAGEVAQAIKNVGIGAGKGAFHTLTGLAPLINKIPYIGETLAPSAGVQAAQRIATPEGAAQKLGYGAEQVGEFMLPGGLEEKGGQFLATKLPWLGRFAASVGRIGTQALTTGAVNKLQGGDFSTGAAMGAGGGVVGEGLKAVAPAVAESALGITKRQRGYGKTPGVAVLEETRGVRPATIERSGQQVSDRLTGQIEQMAQAHPQPVSMAPALQHIDNEIARATAQNNAKAVAQLQDVKNALTSQIGTGAPIPTDVPAMQALNLKRGLRNQFVTNWNPEMMHGTRAVAAGASGELDRALDAALGPGFTSANQRISSLIPVTERAESLERGAPFMQRVAQRVKAPTGALVGALGGGMYGYHRGGIPEAVGYGLGGLLLPEMLASPTVQMAGARALASPLLPRAMRGTALQFTRPSKEEADDEGKAKK